jgi:hypothetical protein
MRGNLNVPHDRTSALADVIGKIAKLAPPEVLLVPSIAAFPISSARQQHRRVIASMN